MMKIAKKLLNANQPSISTIPVLGAEKRNFAFTSLQCTGGGTSYLLPGHSSRQIFFFFISFKKLQCKFTNYTTLQNYYTTIQYY